MQLVLERGSIDKPLTFDVGLIQLSFHIYQSVHLIHATFQSNWAEGLHFSALHYYSNQFSWSELSYFLSILYFCLSPNLLCILFPQQVMN